MNLQHELDQIRRASADPVPEETARLIDALRERQYLDRGDRAPDFTLADARGRRVRLADRASEGPVVLTFYRGGWCPYCNAELRAYQRRMPNIRSAGGSLIAVSPEMPDHSLSTAEKNQLEFDVLSDPGLNAAAAFGLVFELPKTLAQRYDSAGLRLPAVNGEPGWRLPVPATFVIDRDLRIELAHVDPDYRRRLEPDDALEAVRRIVRAEG